MSDILTDAQNSQRRTHRRARGAGGARLDRGDVRHSARRARRADASLSAAMPLLLQPDRTRPRRQRTDDRGMEEGSDRTRRDRRAADPFLRRRTDRAQGSGRTGAARQRCRAVLQSHHLGGAADARKTLRAGRCRAVPCADQFPGQRAHGRRSRRRLKEFAREEDRSRKMDARTRPAADGQCGHAPPEPASALRHHPDGGRSRRRPAGGGQRAVLRLGAEEPRRADADARADRGDQPHRRGSRRCG